VECRNGRRCRRVRGGRVCRFRQAHDLGAKVLILEEAPEGQHGGNTRVAGQGYLKPSSSGSNPCLDNSGRARPRLADGFRDLVSRARYLRHELDAAGHQVDVADPWTRSAGRVRAKHPFLKSAAQIGFAIDSRLEEARFEPSVPRHYEVSWHAVSCNIPRGMRHGAVAAVDRAVSCADSLLEEQDSNHWSRRRPPGIVVLPVLVRAEFPVVGNQQDDMSRPCHSGRVMRDRWFESGFLQRRVSCEPNPRERNGMGALSFRIYRRNPRRCQRCRTCVDCYLQRRSRRSGPAS
jgi:hypothetical protein